MQRKRKSSGSSFFFMFLSFYFYFFLSLSLSLFHVITRWAPVPGPEDSPRAMRVRFYWFFFCLNTFFLLYFSSAPHPHPHLLLLCLWTRPPEGPGLGTRVPSFFFTEFPSSSLLLFVGSVSRFESGDLFFFVVRIPFDLVRRLRHWLKVFSQKKIH